jgi:hypothetical protein
VFGPFFCRNSNHHAVVRASTIIEGPLITIREGCRIAWCPDVSTGGLFSVLYGCGARQRSVF